MSEMLDEILRRFPDIPATKDLYKAIVSLAYSQGRLDGGKQLADRVNAALSRSSVFEVRP